MCTVIKRNEVISIRDSSQGMYSSNRYHRHGSIVLLFRGQRRVLHTGEESNCAQLGLVAEEEEEEEEDADEGKERERHSLMRVRKSRGKKNEYKWVCRLKNKWIKLKWQEERHLMREQSDGMRRRRQEGKKKKKRKVHHHMHERSMHGERWRRRRGGRVTYFKRW